MVTSELRHNQLQRLRVVSWHVEALHGVRLFRHKRYVYNYRSFMQTLV